MSRYKAYPEYKESGIEWLGLIPQHWRTSKVRYIFSFDKGLTITKENLQDEGVPCVNYGEVHSRYGFEVDPAIHALKCVNEEYLISSQNSLLSRGDLIFADTSEDIEGSGNFTQLNSDQTVFAGYHTIIVRPDDKQSYRFYAYLFDCKELRTQIRHAVKGVKVFSITQAILRGVDIWLPSLAEREKIANFLDHETAKIDALIAKQQDLNKLLKEKRQAVISHAVTKGLNPMALMRDSGVEWLGEVPTHWDFAPVRRYLLEHRQGYYTTDSYVEDGIKLLRITDLRELGQISIVDCPKVPFASTLKNYYLQDGDVVFARTGGAGSFGVIQNLDETVAYASYLIRFRFLQKHFNASYLKFMFIADSFQLAVKRNIHGGVTQNIHAEDIKDAFIASPPLKEQLDISLYLEAQSSKYAVLIDKAESAINLMQERRTALISAAVRGKIDVRSWEEPRQPFPALEDATA